MDDEAKKLAEELLFSGKPKPSFAKSLYFGLFDSKHVIPFPKGPDEKGTDELIGKVKAFMDKEVDPVQIDKNGEIPESVIRGFGKLGILSLTIPQQYGGLGMSQYAYCRVMEEIARKCASTALFINAHQSVGLKALLLFGTDAQKDKWLPPLGKGEAIAAFSLTEPNAGSDAGGIETEAVFDPVKKTYRISGKKQWTTNGSIASILTVMAKTDTPNGKKVTAFLVTPDMPGFEVVARALDKVGMRGSITSNLNYNNVEVPEENILGPIGGGLRVALTVLDYGRTTFGATCTGIAKESFDMALKHAKNRYQFKRPLASFALVKDKLAKMAAYIYAMEAATYLTAGLIDKGEDDVMLESAILKVFASEASWQILYDAMQIYGGRSFFTDLPLERMMRDSRLNMIGEGSNEVLRAFIGVVGIRDVGMNLKSVKEALSDPFKEKDKIFGFLKYSKNYLIPPEIHVPGLEKYSGRLAQDVRRFGTSVAKALAKHGEDILERQLVLNRIATIAIALYTSTAVLSRLVDKADDAGFLYLKLAHNLIEEQTQNLFSEDDAMIEKLSDKLTGVKRP